MPQLAENLSIESRWPSVPWILASMLGDMAIDDQKQLHLSFGESDPDPCTLLVDTIRAECARCAQFPLHVQEVEWRTLAEAALEFPGSPCALAAHCAALAMVFYSAGPRGFMLPVFLARAIMSAAKAMPKSIRELKLEGALAACFSLGQHDAGVGRRGFGAGEAIAA
jgi:hypothetical protein